MAVRATLALVGATLGVVALPAAASASARYAVSATIPVDAGPFGVAVDSATGLAYTANINANTVSAIDEASNAVVATIPIGGPTAPESIAVDPSTDTAYVANLGAQDASVLDLAKGTVAALVPVGAGQHAVAVDSATGDAYVTNSSDGTISVISGATNTVSATITVGGDPIGIAMDPATNTAYVANISADTMQIVDLATQTVTHNVGVGDGPRFLALDVPTRTVYVVDQDINAVSVVSLAGNHAIATIPVGSGPAAPSVDPGTDTVYVPNFNDASVSVIDGATAAVITTVPVGNNPAGVAVDPADHLVYVADQGSDTASVITPTIDEPTVTTVASSGSPAAAGSPVTFTASISIAQGMGDPSGTVSFTSDGVAIAGCAAQPLNDVTVRPVTATCTTSALLGGTHSIVATYSGGASNVAGYFFDPSASPAISQSVLIHDPSLTAVSSNASPSAAFGSPVKFTARIAIANGVGVPSGTVSFSSDGVTIAGCAAQPLNDVTVRPVTATCTTSALSAGTHLIVATYSGGPSSVYPYFVDGSESGKIPQTVLIHEPTVTSVTSSGSPAAVGSPVTFTASIAIAHGMGNPSGTVSFSSDGVAIAGCAAQPLNDVTVRPATATCTTSALSAGTHSIVATYSGGASNVSGYFFDLSASPALTQSVLIHEPTVTSVTSSRSPQTTGVPVTFTASIAIAHGMGNPSGTVAFTADGLPIAGCTAQPLNDVTVRPVTATCTTSALAAGTHSIVATYSGGVSSVAPYVFDGSTSPSFSQGVGVIEPTTTTLTASGGQLAFPAELLTLTASIALPKGMGNPTGTVSFTSNGTPIPGCTGLPLDNATVRPVTATCETPAGPAGNYSIVATYTGGASNVSGYFFASSTSRVYSLLVFML
ncbi:MAG TPA: Ig-like domain repeat protein [Solirubrobacteraceae bacterium]